MIQRIQTVYLLVVAILMVVMMSVPVGSFYTDKNICEMTNLSYLLPDGAVNYTPWALFAILVVVAGFGDYFPLPETYVADSSDHLQYDCAGWLLFGTGLFCRKSGQGIR